jgi:hypothetical protein
LLSSHCECQPQQIEILFTFWILQLSNSLHSQFDFIILRCIIKSSWSCGHGMYVQHFWKSSIWSYLGAIVNPTLGAASMVYVCNISWRKGRESAKIPGGQTSWNQPKFLLIDLPDNPKLCKEFS